MDVLAVARSEEGLLGLAVARLRLRSESERVEKLKSCGAAVQAMT